MVDTTKAAESSYVNVDLVRASPTKKAVIIDEGEYSIGEYEGNKYERFSITVEIDRKAKKWNMNRDTIKNIQEEYGVDSADWIGKIIKLSIGKSNGKDTVVGMPIPMVDPRTL